MKTRAFLLLLFAIAFCVGCKEHPRVELPIEPPPKETRKPVVAVAPVPTRPFEDGYNAGFELGRQQGKPRAKLPEAAEVERLAHEQAAGHEDRTERWERGFVDGYTEGFRNVVTGRK